MNQGNYANNTDGKIRNVDSLGGLKKIRTRSPYRNMLTYDFYKQI